MGSLSMQSGTWGKCGRPESAAAPSRIFYTVGWQPHQTASPWGPTPPPRSTRTPGRGGQLGVNTSTEFRGRGGQLRRRRCQRIHRFREAWGQLCQLCTFQRQNAFLSAHQNFISTPKHICAKMKMDNWLNRAQLRIPAWHQAWAWVKCQAIRRRSLW